MSGLKRTGTEVIKGMRKKIGALQLPRGYSVRTVLIHVNGMMDDLKNEDFFSHSIDFAQLLKSS